MANGILTPEITMPEWLEKIQAGCGIVKFTGDADKLRFVIDLAKRNVINGTGGPFAAAIFSMETHCPVALGVNRVVPACQSWAHAEMTAISHAQALLGTLNLRGYSLVTSCEPCAMCFGAIPWSGVSEMIYAADGDMARRINFDEGDKPTAWVESLEKRGIAVRGPMLPLEAVRPFELYAEGQGVIY